MPAGEPTPVLVRIAAAWDSPAARAFCERLEEEARKSPEESVIHRGRNLLFRVPLAGEEIAVKRFPVAGLRRVLDRARPTKAVRAFDHAARLVALGVGTPRPLAAVELRRGYVPVASFYCCAFVPALGEARDLKRPDAAGRDALLERLGAFVGALHDRGVVHRDLTSGNVLFVRPLADGEEPEFQLVDVNRMRFGRVGALRGLANLAQLRLADGGALLAGYCRARALDPAAVAPWYRALLALRGVRQRVKERTRPLRRRLGL